MSSNGYVGTTGVAASVDGWLGATVSHVPQLSLALAMSDVMPGQKTDACALAVIWDTP